MTDTEGQSEIVIVIAIATTREVGEIEIAIDTVTPMIAIDTATDTVTPMIATDTVIESEIEIATNQSQSAIAPIESVIRASRDKVVTRIMPNVALETHCLASGNSGVMAKSGVTTETTTMATRMRRTIAGLLPLRYAMLSRFYHIQPLPHSSIRFVKVINQFVKLLILFIILGQGRFDEN